MNEPKFLIPLVERGKTGWFQQNFLWKAGNVYVMDNHRSAAWCWAREVDASKGYSLFHVDRHNDSQEPREEWIKAFPKRFDISIQDYLAVDYEAYGGDRSLVVNWGNHLSLYLSLYPKAQTVFFATHNDGQELSIVKPWPIPPWDLPDNLEYWVNDAGLPCIMNIDLDYFFCTVDDKAIRFLDDAYFDALSAAVARLNKDGKLAVITIALTATDDLTNGWHPAEALATRMCKALGYDFKLPD